MKILITGSSQGIGKAIAELFLKNGHSVTGFDRQPSAIANEHYTHYQLDICNTGKASMPVVSVSKAICVELPNKAAKSHMASSVSTK